MSDVALLATVAGISLALLELVIRRSDVGAGLVLVVLLLQEAAVLDLYQDLGGFRVSINDLLFVVLLTAAIARLLRVNRLSTPQRLLVLLGVIVLWALLRGAGPFGIQEAVNQGRKFLLFTASVLYFSTVEWRRDLFDRIGWLWIGTAAVLCLFSVIRWMMIVAGISGPFVEGAYGGTTLRVIPAIHTLIIAQAAWITLPLMSQRSRGLIRFSSPAFFAFVLVLQHRTVWVLTAVGTLYLLYRERAIATRVLSALAAALIVLAGLAFTILDESDVALGDQLAESAQSTGTFEWRFDGWVALLRDSGPENATEFMTGRPFGLPWDRVMPNGRVVEVSPHSFYVEPFLRVGAIGLAALLIVYAISLRGTLAVPRGRAEDQSLLNPTLLHTIIAVQLLFYVTYTPDAAQAMLLGLGTAVAAVAAAPNRAHVSTQPVDR
jgi:hypothetical protein